MKRFIIKTAAFFLVLGAVLFLADYPLSRAVRKIHTFGLDTWRDVMESAAGADILIQGNSRAFNACDQAVIDSVLGLPAYNLTTVGNLSLVQLFRYGMYRKYNRKPRLVLQFVDEITLGTDIAEYDRIQFLPWMWNKSFSQGILGFDRRFFAKNAIPVLRYHGYRPWSLAMQQRMTRNGFYLPEYELFQDTTFHHAEDLCPIFLYSDFAAGRMKDFLRNASEEGVRVVLVRPPLHESVHLDEGEEEKMMLFYRSLADEAGVPLFDASSMEIIHDSTLFLDEGHLNMKGSRIFTDSLARFVTDLKLLED